MDNTIALARQTISLEARGGRDPLELFHARLPKFITNVREFLKTLIGKGAPKPELVDMKPMIRALEEIGYMRAQKLKVYTPTGMDVTYLEYLTILEASQEAVERLESGLISPFKQWIGKMLTDPSELASVRGNGTPKDVVFSDIDAIREMNENAFDQRKAKAEQSLGDVFNRLKDVEATQEKANGLIERLARIDRKKLTKSVEELSELLSKLTKRIQEEEEGYSVSNKTIESLSALVYEVAVEVEHYSVYVHSIEALTNALQDTNDYIKKAIR